MALAGFYRRALPSPPAIDFSSSEGKQLFIEAFHNGTMEGFYKLISYFQTQSEPAYCGLASLSMVLNALAIDPGRKWKGPWRWFDESMLDCCEPLETVKHRGITFGKLVCLAHCAGAKVEAYRATQSTIDEFRKYVISCSSSENCHVISSYHREVLEQTGEGHFSPIGGYHAGKDMALILDVARFKYPPHWIPLTLLWQAMEKEDTATGKSRGFMMISSPHAEPGMLYTLSCKHESWIGIAKFLVDDVPALLSSKKPKEISQTLSIILTSLPLKFDEFIKWVAEVRRGEAGASIDNEESSRLALKTEILKQVKQTPLYGHITNLNSSCGNAHSCDQAGDLSQIAASVCCEGAGILAGKCGTTASFRCKETCLNCTQLSDDTQAAVVSGTVTLGQNKEGLEVLVPLSEKLECGCVNVRSVHPAFSDVLTALMLALPNETWAGIKDEKLFHQLSDLVSLESLPQLLKEEVLHLQRQLRLLKRCQEGKIDDDLGAPSTSHANR